MIYVVLALELNMESVFLGPMSSLGEVYIINKMDFFKEEICRI